MSRTLVWDAGPGEIRAGLIEDGNLSEFRIIRPRHDKPLMQAGELYTLRITQRLGKSSALATMGIGEDGVIAPCTAPEGTLIAAEMMRPPVPEPGRWKRAKYRPIDGAQTQSAPGWHFSDEPWLLHLKSIAPQVDAILCPNAAIANEMEQHKGGLSVRIDAEAIDDADFEMLIAQAVAGEFPITNGALSIERTRAMTVIDVDGTGETHKLNLAAAREIPRLLRLFDIGGPIAIDFIASANRAERQAVDEALAEALTGLGPHERTAINGFGLAQIIRPRARLSIPEILCGTTPGRLSLESRAIALLRDAGRAQGIGKRQLIAPPAIIDLIRQWPEETGALRFSLGAEIELVSDPSVTGYGHVHVQQG